MKKKARSDQPPKPPKPPRPPRPKSLAQRVTDLEARVSILEGTPAPASGAKGERGEKGDKGKGFWG